jgi:hypothetical protein
MALGLAQHGARLFVWVQMAVGKSRPAWARGDGEVGGAGGRGPGLLHGWVEALLSLLR